MDVPIFFWLSWIVIKTCVLVLVWTFNFLPFSFCFLACLVVWFRVSLCSPSSPGTHSVDLTGLILENYLPLPTKLKACATLTCFNFLDLYLGMKLIWWLVTLCLVLWGTTRLLPDVTIPFYSPRILEINLFYIIVFLFRSSTHSFDKLL